MLKTEANAESSRADWEYLDEEVSQLESWWDPEEHPILEMIKSNPITVQSIRNLFDQGWQVFSLPNTLGGYCRWSTKTIFVGGRYSPYARDITLCHEIVHAHYPVPELYDFRNICHKDRLENELITEWYGRKLRANPRILRELARNLAGTNKGHYVMQPVIYDRATFLAFGLHGYDIGLAIKRYPQSLKRIPLLMDPPAEITTQLSFDGYESPPEHLLF